MASRMRRIAKSILAVIVLSACYLDYWAYSRDYYSSPHFWMDDVIRGTAAAPGQYRVGVIWSAYWMSVHLHIGMRHSLTILDTISALAAVFLLYDLLLRSSVFRSASITAQYFGSAAYIAVIQLYLAWLLFYQRPETLPTSMLAAVFLWLWSQKKIWLDRSTGGRCITVVCIILISIAQALVRADVVCMLNIGIFLVCLSPLGDKLALPRVVAIATSLCGTALAAGIQIFFMKVIYPHATYGNTPIFQLIQNITDYLRLLPFALFVIPYAWTVVQAARLKFTEDASDVAFLIGSLLFGVAWATVGSLGEVRIFIPVALALTPLTVKLAIKILEFDGSSSPGKEPSSARESVVFFRQ